MDTRTWMEKYLVGKVDSSFTSPFYCFGILALIFGFSGATVMLFVGIAFLAAAYWISNKNKRAYTTWLGAIQNQEKEQALLRDFQSAQDYFGGELRLGQNWVYGKGSNRAYAYGEITKVYQCIHKKRILGEVDRNIEIVGLDGIAVNLCRIPQGGQGDAELNVVLNNMLAKNPQMHIGYK